MAIYIVTGKLGGGKTLACISKINDALGQGKKVATNLDLKLHNLPLVGKMASKVNVVRLPDKPTVKDIQDLGNGSDAIGHDESRAGLLVLDECGTWLNSRDWQAEGRKELISYLLHIRKMGWDVYLIIQDISMLDKQARKALAEHVVYCRRTDRMNIPFIGAIFKLFTGGTRMPVPKWHIAMVKYGDQQHSLQVDSWWYNGNELYNAYDTTQVFLEEYETPSYCYVPPILLHHKSKVKKWTRENVMRLTHIYLRKYSLITIASAGISIGSLLTYLFVVPATNSIQEKEQSKTIAAKVTRPQDENTQLNLPTETLSIFQPQEEVIFSRLKISESYSIRTSEYVPHYRFKFTDGNRTYTVFDLAEHEIEVDILDHCKAFITSQKGSKLITCT